MNTAPGVQRVTADAAIGISGQPVRIYCVSLVSGATASVLSLRNGTSASASVNEQIDGVISSCTTKNYAGGLLFPAGCFADVDANITFATIVFSTET